MTDQQIEVRRARPGDAPTIAEIWRTGWNDGHLGNVPDDLVTARTAESFHTRAAQRVDDTTVALAGGEIAGFVMVHADEVDQVYVAAAHRGAGIADLLLDDAERQVGGAGHATAWLAVVPGNSRARRFYERRGWTDTGPFVHSAPGAHGPIPVPCHRYVKDVRR
ncbi:GNAT family N-acetyltransferase [Actinopolymorpha sp. B9G3]|uniref:GNAT family N-acetyltransferase n=1 Tax=Actinopolymorpha sp. B9G3 TaxID=3158970 RepID=UPI0032D9906E